MDLDLSIREQLLRQLPKALSELKVLWLRRDGVTRERQVLANNGVCERAGDLDVLAAGLAFLNWQQEGDLATLLGQCLGADLGRGALGDTVEGMCEFVLGVGADVGADGGGVVVEGLFGAEGLDEGVVAW